MAVGLDKLRLTMTKVVQHSSHSTRRRTIQRWRALQAIRVLVWTSISLLPLKTGTERWPGLAVFSRTSERAPTDAEARFMVCWPLRLVRALRPLQIGRASCRERVCQYV